MTIKQTGGIFGRNPTFNNVESNSSTVNGILKVSNNHNSEFIHLDSANTTDEAYIRIESTDLVFDTDPSALRPTSKIIFKSDGVDVLEIAGGDQGGDITPLGNVILNDGQGIDFSATSGTGTSELFDDYEEGTFTATFGGSTSEGDYTKIGRQVICEILVNANRESFSQITGLPFTAATGGYTGGFFGRGLRADYLDANGVPCRAAVSGTAINFKTNVSTGGDSSFTITTDASGAVRLGITVVYYV